MAQLVIRKYWQPLKQFIITISTFILWTQFCQIIENIRTQREEIKVVWKN